MRPGRVGEDFSRGTVRVRCRERPCLDETKTGAEALLFPRLVPAEPGRTQQIGVPVGARAGRRPWHGARDRFAVGRAIPTTSGPSTAGLGPPREPGPWPGLLRRRGPRPPTAPTEEPVAHLWRPCAAARRRALIPPGRRPPAPPGAWGLAPEAPLPDVDSPALTVPLDPPQPPLLPARRATLRRHLR